MDYTKLKLIFLGTGDAFHTGGRANQAVWVQGKHTILLECGPTTLYQMIKFGLNPNELDLILITHFHFDHAGGVPGVQLYLSLVAPPRSRKINYCGPVGLGNSLLHFFQHCYQRTPFSSERCPVSFTEIQPDETTSLFEGTVKVQAAAMRHVPESLGYEVMLEDRKITITGDTSWNQGIPNISNNADLLICECYNYSMKDNTHLSYQEIMANRKMINAKRIILTHPGPEMLERIDKLDLEVAWDGMQVSI